VFPVGYELSLYNPEDVILHSHRRENLNSYERVLLVMGALVDYDRNTKRKSTAVIT
jgi:hypothetical protein